MTIRTASYLKGKFNTGDKPTEADFADLIDSMLNLLSSMSDNSVLSKNPSSAAGSLAVPEDRILGRLAGENIKALTPAEVVTLLGVQAISTGLILPWGGPAETIPEGFLLCDGSELLIEDYEALYSKIGNIHGDASDDDHFLLPNTAGRFLWGADGTHEAGTRWGNLDTSTEGEHSHTVVLDPPLVINNPEIGTPANVAASGTPATSENGDHSHTINPPGAAFHFIIKT